MRVGVIGINHKLGNLKLRELLAKACQRRFIAGSSLHGDHTFVLLTTCNRTEVYFSSDDLVCTHSYLLQILRYEVEDEFDQKVYSYFGHDCFLHLARVTAGLDSAIVAETEIQGQVKAAYENASRHIALPGELHYLFQKALRIGKQVRTLLPLGRGMPDLEHAIFQAGVHLFKKPQNKRILFVGASDINQKVLAFLRGREMDDITLCNRTFERAKAVSSAQRVSLLHWEKIVEWHQFDWIIFGTKAPDYLIRREDFPETVCSQKLVIDLCVPRNVDPRLGRDKRITLMNIDQINRILRVRKQKMADTLQQAEQVVAKAAHYYVNNFQSRSQFNFHLHRAI